MFENISKGKFTNDGIDVIVNGFIVAQSYDTTDACVNEMNIQEAESNAEFIAYCFNLQQRLDISCYEEVIKALEKSMAALRLDEWQNSQGYKEIEQILNKAKK